MALEETLLSIAASFSTSHAVAAGLVR